ncbi:hypothetical protein C0Z18_25080 [Trinickia dabaoshanensis]|uniref:Uncharacterized protein n=1 Tax=Trinickia dabaoshanensis TaxID=564714 RepID=A0A2N7VFS8_9BURK|nr:hypothetical protein C0Z18_25080 [Trinickia dabaoshanensis]
MRRSGKKISDRIQSAVMGVYKHALTLRGEMRQNALPHLDWLPQRLTGTHMGGQTAPLRRLAFTAKRA